MNENIYLSDRVYNVVNKRLKEHKRLEIYNSLKNKLGDDFDYKEDSFKQVITKTRKGYGLFNNFGLLVQIAVIYNWSLDEIIYGDYKNLAYKELLNFKDELKCFNNNNNGKRLVQNNSKASRVIETLEKFDTLIFHNRIDSSTFKEYSEMLVKRFIFGFTHKENDHEKHLLYYRKISLNELIYFVKDNDFHYNTLGSVYIDNPKNNFIIFNPFRLHHISNESIGQCPINSMFIKDSIKLVKEFISSKLNDIVINTMYLFEDERQCLRGFNKIYTSFLSTFTMIRLLVLVCKKNNPNEYLNDIKLKLEKSLNLINKKFNELIDSKNQHYSEDIIEQIINLQNIFIQKIILTFFTKKRGRNSNYSRLNEYKNRIKAKQDKNTISLILYNIQLFDDNSDLLHEIDEIIKLAEDLVLIDDINPLKNMIDNNLLM